MSVNKVILLGRVGKDPDVRYVAQNQPVASFTLATTDHAYTNANGVQVPERTEWHNIVMWGKNAEIAERYIRKGTQIYLEGRLRTRAWEDRNQVKRYTTEIYVDTFELLARPTTSQPAPQP
jgi:single-strand DNA-binding protein